LQDNLKKTIAYTLAHAVPEVWPLFLALVLNFPLGESCVHQFASSLRYNLASTGPMLAVAAPVGLSMKYVLGGANPSVSGMRS
jgi:hypothetical protein